MTKPEVLRELAAESLELAVCSPSEEGTAELIDLAKDYLESASYYELRFVRAVRLTRWGRGANA